MAKVEKFNNGDHSLREELDFLEDYIDVLIAINKNNNIPVYKEFFDTAVVNRKAPIEM
jgi:hypothetical protein